MNTLRSRHFAIFLCLTALVHFVGCGGGEKPEPKATIGVAKGKVSYKGTPVTDGQIEFWNTTTKISYVGKLQAGGTYEAKGIPAGDYAVIVGPVPPVSSMSKPAEKPANPADIPAKYRKAETSGLKTSITKGDNAFDVDMQD